PHIHPAFKDLSSNCRLYSFANPGPSTAFEFNDGKMLIAQMGDLNKLGWEDIKHRIGLDILIKLYSQTDLFCIVNWSELDSSTGVWKGLLDEVIVHLNKDKSKTSFFDLSDCSKRTTDAILEALTLLKKFATHSKVILSLNRNEASLVYQAFYNKKSDQG